MKCTDPTVCPRCGEDMKAWYICHACPDPSQQSMRKAMAEAMNLKEEQLPGFEAIVYSLCAETNMLRKRLKEAEALLKKHHIIPNQEKKNEKRR